MAAHSNPSRTGSVPEDGISVRAVSPDLPTPEMQPSRYHGPFQKPDFAHWGKMLIWNCFEIGCLTCGYEPSSLVDVEEQAARAASPGAYETIHKRWDLIQRECYKDGGDGPMTPLGVLDWLDSIEEPYPKELRDVATRIGKKRVSPTLSEPMRLPRGLSDVIASTARRTDLIKEDNPSAALTRKYHTHQKVVLAMALHKYGHNPHAGRGFAVAEIMRATELHGLRVSDDTIRNMLREAYEEHGFPE